MAPRPRWPAGFQRNVLAAAKRLRGCAAPKNPQSVRASNVAPRPSVRSGRPDFIIFTPPRNSSHPSFLFFFFVCATQRQRRHAGVAPSVKRRNAVSSPLHPGGQSGVRGGGGVCVGGYLWTAEPLSLRRTDDTRPTWIAELVAQTNVNFFLPHLFYCYFGSDKKMPPTNCLENRVALYMFGLNYGVTELQLVFLCFEGKKEII